MQRALASFCHKPSSDLKPPLVCLPMVSWNLWFNSPLWNCVLFSNTMRRLIPHVGLDFGLFMFVRFMYYVTCAWKINTLMCSILMSEDIEDGWWNMIKMMEPFVLGLWNGWQWPVLLWFRPMISQMRQSRQIAPVQSNFMVKIDAVL